MTDAVPGPEKAITIREAKPEDDDAILRIHRDAILQLGRSAYSEADCRSWAEGAAPGRYREAITGGGETFLIAEAAGRAVGFCSFTSGEIVGLYVAPAVARTGVGSRLLRAADDRIGARPLHLTSALSALDFYRAQGYQLVGQRSWRTRGGRDLAVCDMRKD